MAPPRGNDQVADLVEHHQAPRLVAHTRPETWWGWAALSCAFAGGFFAALALATCLTPLWDACSFLTETWRT